MDIDEARRVIAENQQAVFSARRADGGPQMSPIVVGLREDGRIAISSRETAYKVRMVRRDPRVSICVLSKGFYGRWIQVDGTADILSLPDAMEPLVEYYRSTAGEHPDWDEYRRAMAEQQRVLILVTIERAGPDRQG